MGEPTEVTNEEEVNSTIVETSGKSSSIEVETQLIKTEKSPSSEVAATKNEALNAKEKTESPEATIEKEVHSAMVEVQSTQVTEKSPISEVGTTEKEALNTKNQVEPTEAANKEEVNSTKCETSAKSSPIEVTIDEKEESEVIDQEEPTKETKKEEAVNKLVSKGEDMGLSINLDSVSKGNEEEQNIKNDLEKMKELEINKKEAITTKVDNKLSSEAIPEEKDTSVAERRKSREEVINMREKDYEKSAKTVEQESEEKEKFESTEVCSTSGDQTNDIEISVLETSDQKKPSHITDASMNNAPEDSMEVNEASSETKEISEATFQKESTVRTEQAIVTPTKVESASDEKNQDKSSNDIITTNKPVSESSEMGAKDEASTIEEKKDTNEPSKLIEKEGKTGETVTLSVLKETNKNKLHDEEESKAEPLGNESILTEHHTALTETKEKIVDFERKEVSESIQEEKFAEATKANMEGVVEKVSTETKIKIEESVVSEAPMKEDQEDTP